MPRRARYKNMLRTGILTGARAGLISGVAMLILSGFAAAMLKGLITDFSGNWPEWFTGASIVDFVLSGRWIIIVLVTFTIAGAIVGAITQRRYELL